MSKDTFIKKWLVTFEGGACIIGQPDADTAVALAKFKYPDKEPYHVYKATKEDERICAQAGQLPPRARRHKLEYVPFPEHDPLNIKNE